MTLPLRFSERIAECGFLRAPGAGQGKPVSKNSIYLSVNFSEEFLGQRDDDARRASNVAEPVFVLVLGHLADEFGTVGTPSSDSVVEVFHCKHDAPEA